MNAGAHHSEDKLLDYAYGELPAHEASAIDAHVRTCVKCSQALAQIKSVRSVFAPLPMVAAPDAGLESLLAYAEQHAKRRRGPVAPWRRWIFGLASAAALVVVGVVALRATKEAPQSAAEVVAEAAREARLEEASKANAAVLKDELPAPAAAAPKPLERDAPANAKAPAAPITATRKGADPRPGDSDVALYSDPPSTPREKKSLAGFAEDYGNAGRGVGLLEGKSERQTKEASKKDSAPKLTEVNKPMPKQVWEAPSSASNVDDQRNDGTTAQQGLGGSADRGRFGLGTGSSYQPAAGREQDAKQAPVADAPEKLAAGPAANEDKAKPRDDERIAPIATASPPAPVPAAEPRATPKKMKSSYGLPQRSLPSAAPVQTEELESATADSDTSGARRVEQVKLVRAELDVARALAAKGDLRGSVRSAVNALSAGATGYERAEALKRACDGFEALGELDRAGSYCDLLLAEFPSTAAAKSVAQRRAKAATKRVTSEEAPTGKQ